LGRHRVSPNPTAKNKKELAILHQGVLVKSNEKSFTLPKQFEWIDKKEKRPEKGAFFLRKLIDFRSLVGQYSSNQRDVLKMFHFNAFSHFKY